MTMTTIWDIEEHRGEPPGIRRSALQESLRHLESYLADDGILEPCTVAPEHGGNPLIARSAEGIYVCDFLNALRSDPDSPLMGRGIQRIRDDDGRLFLTGTRNGETVDVEVRQLTDEGAARLDALAAATTSPPHWVSPVNHAYAPGRAMWDGVLALWDDPGMAAAPEYAARSAYLPKVKLSKERITSDAEANTPLTEQAVCDLVARVDDRLRPYTDPDDLEEGEGVYHLGDFGYVRADVYAKAFEGEPEWARDMYMLDGNEPDRDAEWVGLYNTGGLAALDRALDRQFDEDRADYVYYTTAEAPSESFTLLDPADPLAMSMQADGSGRSFSL